jgi:phosphoglycolate phosphatase-like HAD superfamily hydrolase
MTPLLFDVDGTLLRVTDGVTQAAAHAVSTVTGHSLSTDGVVFSGRTDPHIFRDVLRASGVAAPDAVLDDVLAAYVEAAQDTIRPADVKVFPGVRSLLAALSERDDVILGLLTGNVEPVAYHKLRCADLAGPFSVGAFGSDHGDRAVLPALATRRLAARTGRSLSPERAVIIGDTEKDIACARAAGSRAVVVCTGHDGRDDLLPHAPDLLFDDFRAPRTCIEQILAL